VTGRASMANLAAPGAHIRIQRFRGPVCYSTFWHRVRSLFLLQPGERDREQQRFGSTPACSARKGRGS
jgi:hypothetical protein